MEETHNNTFQVYTIPCIKVQLSSGAGAIYFQKESAD